VRCRTDGKHGVVQAVIGFWGASHGMPLVPCRVDSPSGNRTNGQGHFMLYTIAVVLLILWLAGLVTSYTLGGFVHILLAVAIIMILFNLISGRRAA
jgi:uncharacterized protein involved in tellurium resistance